MKPVTKNFLLLAMMIAASGLAIAMRPTQKIADMGPAVKLETMIPKTFDGWQEEQQNQTQIVDPQQKELIDKIYNQTLSRTYTNNDGYRIMLSIAYGSDQSDAKQVHKPEVCYPAQGFTLNKLRTEPFEFKSTKFPITRIETNLGQREEPVTYWITVGKTVVGTGFEKKAAELKYGLAGKIPDGLLFRVSSIDKNADRAFAKQDTFIRSLINALPDNDRERIIGKPGALLD